MIGLVATCLLHQFSLHRRNVFKSPSYRLHVLIQKLSILADHTIFIHVGRIHIHFTPYFVPSFIRLKAEDLNILVQFKKRLTPGFIQNFGAFLFGELCPE